MKVIASQVEQTTSHFFRQEDIHQERTFAWKGDERPPAPNETASPPQTKQDTLSISNQAITRFQTTSTPECICLDEEEEIALDPKIRTMRLILEAITGRKVSVTNLSLSAAETVPSQLAKSDSSKPDLSTNEVRQGWGLEYDLIDSHEEEEQLQFHSSGEIQCADGKKIAFAVDLVMDRHFYESTEIHIRAGDARLVDPLVINLDDSAVELTDSTFSFDLDGDGSEEEISSLAAGHGFLAFDKNNDGIINSGNELFGPATGNGFNELAAYDQDSNGWLDDNDPLYAKLLVWATNQAGEDELHSLAEHGIGALYLQGAAGEFSLTDQNNNLLGQVRESSIFIREDGRIGTMQEIDMVV